MKHKFKIGDVVRVIKGEYLGTKFMIKGVLGKFSDFVPMEHILKDGFKDCPVYEIGHGFGYAEEIALELYYDGNAKSSWVECIWKPKQLVRSK